MEFSIQLSIESLIIEFTTNDISQLHVVFEENPTFWSTIRDNCSRLFAKRHSIEIHRCQQIGNIFILMIFHNSWRYFGILRHIFKISLLLLNEWKKKKCFEKKTNYKKKIWIEMLRFKSSNAKSCATSNWDTTEIMTKFICT